MRQGEVAQKKNKKKERHKAKRGGMNRRGGSRMKRTGRKITEVIKGKKREPKKESGRKEGERTNSEEEGRVK